MFWFILNTTCWAMRYTLVLGGWRTIRFRFLAMLAVLKVNRQFYMALTLVMLSSIQNYSSITDTYIRSTHIHEDILHTTIRTESNQFVWNHPHPLFTHLVFSNVFPNHIIFFFLTFVCQSQWPRGLRRSSATARLLRSWVRIPAGSMYFCLLWVLCVIR